MLIEISVSNFRSIRETQTFSLAKGKGDELADTNTFEVPTTTGSLQLLRSAVIYGPNASGKSNFMWAILAMLRIVTRSATEWRRGHELPVTPFFLSSKTRRDPSEFEVIFIVDEIRYQYGFSATRERIYDEWLYAFPKGRAQCWFSRKWSIKDNRYEWDLGNHLTGEKQTWQKATRDNALFLSTAVNLNSKQLEPIFDWFSLNLEIAMMSSKIGVIDHLPFLSASMCESDEKSKIIDFLRAVDIDISDIQVKKRPFESIIPSEISENIAEEFKKDMEGMEIPDIRTMHKDDNGKMVAFSLDDESEGTQRFFTFAGPWLETLKNGHVLFIDELHIHLHPKLVRFLVQLFHSNEWNRKNAQLIFTTHETSILTQEVFRRDQVWFFEKSELQSSILYPLIDFKPRKGRENLELSYLSGRYGAVPFVKSIDKG